jgi:hypothetical protein
MNAPASGPTTRFGRLEARGILLGLSGPQLALVSVAAVIAVAAVYSTGMAGLLASAPVWVVLVAVGTARTAGRPVLAWLPLLASWGVRRATGTTSAAATTRGVHPRGVLVVPGLAARFELVDCEPLGGALLLDRRAGTATGVLAISGDGFVLDDASGQEVKVAAWGRALAALCQQPSVVRAQILTRTRPSSAAAARDWWRTHCNAARGAGTLLDAVARMLEDGFVEPRAHEMLLALAVRVPRGRRQWRAPELSHAASTLSSLAAVHVGASSSHGWLGTDQLIRALRAGLDPYPAARREGVPVGGAGLVEGVRESWGSLAVGTAVHATYWVSEWPRVEVHASFLQPLLLGEVGERTLSLIAEPLGTARALRDIRRAKIEHAADAAQRARIGQIENEATRAEVADLERREAELVAGHGDLRFTGLVTVTARSEDELEQRCAAMETAAAQAVCEVTRLVGQQGVAHTAAALPLARGVL